MKKLLIFFGVIAIILIIILFSAAPTKKMDLELDGVLYKLEDENYQESVVVRIEGEYYNKLFSDKRFEGTIHIDQYILYSLHLEFDENNSAVLKSYSPWLSLRGTVFIDDDFSKFTICFSDCSVGDWNIEENLMLSAPATIRDEALNVSKEIFVDLSDMNYK